jgi:hypothetical protein
MADAEEGVGMAEPAGRPPTAIVIGAGFGGISAAGRLARAGYSVTCVEKHATPGGRCCEIVEQGHRFDVGPSIILVPSAYREAFTAMGDDLDRHLDFIRVDPTYKIHFHDGTSLELTADLQRMEVLCASRCLLPARRARGARATTRPADLDDCATRMQAQLEAIERGSFKSFLSLLRQGYDNLHETLGAIAHRNFYSFFEFFSLKNGLLIWKLGRDARSQLPCPTPPYAHTHMRAPLASALTLVCAGRRAAQALLVRRIPLCRRAAARCLFVPGHVHRRLALRRALHLLAPPVHRILRRYVCVYIHTETDTKTHRHTDTQTHRHTHIYMYMHTYVFIHSTYFHTYIHAYVSAYIHMLTYTQECGTAAEGSPASPMPWHSRRRQQAFASSTEPK